MSQEHGFGYHRSNAARPDHADNRDDQMDKEDEEIAHGLRMVVRSDILTSLRNPRDSAINQNSHPARELARASSRPYHYIFPSTKHTC